MLFRRRRTQPLAQGRAIDDHSARRAKGRGRRLALERLEPRRLLALDLVSSVIDPTLAGDAPNGVSDEVTQFSLTADGRYAVFASGATNLVPGDSNQSYDVFLRDLQAGVTRRLSTDSAGDQSDGSSHHPAISADGRYVASKTRPTRSSTSPTRCSRATPNIRSPMVWPAQVGSPWSATGTAMAATGLSADTSAATDLDSPGASPALSDLALIDL